MDTPGLHLRIPGVGRFEVRPGHLCQVSVHPPSREPLRGTPKSRSSVASPEARQSYRRMCYTTRTAAPAGWNGALHRVPTRNSLCFPQRRAHTPNRSSAAHVSSTGIYCSCQSLEIKRYDPEEHRTMSNGAAD